MTHRWRELSPRTRRLLLVGGTIEGILKVAALVDLWRRPRTEVNGSKVKWGLAILLVNSAGVVPVGYFLRGRKAG